MEIKALLPDRGWGRQIRQERFSSGFFLGKAAKSRPNTNPEPTQCPKLQISKPYPKIRPALCCVWQWEAIRRVNYNAGSAALPFPALSLCSDLTPGPSDDNNRGQGSLKQALNITQG